MLPLGSALPAAVVVVASPAVVVSVVPVESLGAVVSVAATVVSEACCALEVERSRPKMVAPSRAALSSNAHSTRERPVGLDRIMTAPPRDGAGQDNSAPELLDGYPALHLLALVLAVETVPSGTGRGELHPHLLAAREVLRQPLPLQGEVVLHGVGVGDLEDDARARRDHEGRRCPMRVARLQSGGDATFQHHRGGPVRPPERLPVGLAGLAGRAIPSAVVGGRDRAAGYAEQKAGERAGKHGCMTPQHLNAPLLWGRSEFLFPVGNSRPQHVIPISTEEFPRESYADGPGRGTDVTAPFPSACPSARPPPRRTGPEARPGRWRFGNSRGAAPAPAAASRDPGAAGPPPRGRASAPGPERAGRN